MNNFRDRQTTDMSSYDYNIDRRLMERNTFNLPSQQDQEKYGEITGEYLELPQIDKGMPMRSHIVPAINNVNSFDNPYLDFNLYREKPNLKVSYFDPLTQNSDQLRFSQINDSTKPILQSQSSLNTSIIDSSNAFTFDFLEKFLDLYKTDYFLLDFSDISGVLFNCLSRRKNWNKNNITIVKSEKEYILDQKTKFCFVVNKNYEQMLDLFDTFDRVKSFL